MKAILVLAVLVVMGVGVSVYQTNRVNTVTRNRIPQAVNVY